MGKFIGCFIVFFSFIAPALGQDKIALQIYFQDGFAFPKNSEDLFERIFSELRSDLTYRRISISSNLLKESEILNGLKEQISSSLKPGEELAVLIIDTHGSTGKSLWGSPVTSLRNLGKAYETEVDPDFKETFSSLRGRAAKDLQIILNSCSPFCGGHQSAALRAKAILDYFGAPDGSIYGSDVAEVSQAFDQKKYFKWKYLLPDLKMMLSMTALTTGLMFPVFGYAEWMTVGEQNAALLQSLWQASQKSLALGVGASALTAALAPVFQFISSKYFLNRGYYFLFKSGELSKSFRVVKYKDLKALISNDVSALSCDGLLSGLPKSHF